MARTGPVLSILLLNRCNTMNASADHGLMKHLEENNVVHSWHYVTQSRCA